jgi:alkylated DNA repair dioxygenase AlkB
LFPTEIKQDGVDVAYTPGFIPPGLTRRLFEAVMREAAWEQPTIRVFGREHLVPRLVAWHADEGITYGYSGQQHPSRPWTPALQEIRELVEKHHGPQHAVLVNLYRDGSHGIAPHADDEDDLEPDAPILMVSLGAERRFVIKHRTTGARHVLGMEDGSLLAMRGSTNAVAVHGVPKTARPVGARISLTFRRMAASGGGARS